MAEKKSKNGPSEDSAATGASWQAQKSAMTRDKILDAAIECFITLGYTKVTTAKVSDTAGVSRGAMLHHFPSKLELIRAAIEYLHDKLLEDFTQRMSDIPASLQGRHKRRAGLDAYYDHLHCDLFAAYHELSVAGRTDPEMDEILQQSVERFEDHILESNKTLWKEWSERGDLYMLAMDLTKFLMEGMAVGHIGRNKPERVKRLIDYLADRLEEIFEGQGPTAISRHSAS
ncbi:MAG: AcrR family transcriptional regulator [Halioglobus sp.]|jgi:AcrR family transcriptional regulator